METPFLDSFGHYAQADAALKYSSGQPSLNATGGIFGTTGANQQLAQILFDLPSASVGFAMYARSQAIVTPGTGIPVGLSFLSAQGNSGVNGFSLNFQWTADGRVAMVLTSLSGSLTLVSDMTRAMHARTWHHVAGSVTIHESPTPPSPPHTVDCVINIDGVNCLNTSGIPWVSNVFPAALEQAGLPAGISGMGQDHSALAITAGDVYPPGSVVRLEPDGDDTIQWAEPPSPVLHYTQIDETIMSTVDSIATDTPNDLDLFTLQNLSASIIGNPSAAQSVFYAVGIDKIYHVWDVSEFLGGYAFFSRHPETAPTTANINALKLGVRYKL